MDSEEPRSKGASQAVWFLTRARVAVALAVIKDKPAGVSGREHAEALARELGSQDESWKKKARELQQEVLRLRQEMLIATVTSATKSAMETAGHDSAGEDVSQDLFGPPDLQPDSETPELLQLEPPPAPSIAEPPVPSSRLGRPQDEAMRPHVQFLQTLCALHRVEGSNRGLEALWFGPDGDAGSVLTDSVCRLLDSVAAACRDPPPPGPRDLVPQACQVAARAMDLFCSQRLPSVEFTGRVEESLRELTELLLHSNQPSGVSDGIHREELQAAERLVEYLITLGSSSMSKSFLIRHILAQISALADRLWQAFQGQGSSGLDAFPVDQYQNSCHLFWILEELLLKSKVPCRVEAGSEQMGFLSHLEQRAFLLSEEFPLFSICMWRIGGLLACSERQDPPSERNDCGRR